MNLLTKTCPIVGIVLAVLPASTSYADVGVLPPAAAHAPAPHSTPQVRTARAWHSGYRPINRPAVKAHTDGAAFALKPNAFGEQDGTTRHVASSLVSAQPLALMPAISHARTSAAMVEVPTGKSLSVNKFLRVGDSEIYDFNGIKTTAVGDPTVADIVPLSTRQLLVNAKAAGTTTIFVFDGHGKNVLHITVLPATNMGPIASRIEQEIGISTVTARSVNGTVFLEGTVENAAASQRAEAIAIAYAPKVKNVIQVAVPQATSAAATYTDLLNQNLSASGITAKVIDDHTILLSGKYAPPISSRVTGRTYNDNNGITTEHLSIDPLERLLSTLPADLKVVNMINFTTKAPRQILVRAKVIDIDRSSLKNFGLQWGNVNYQGVGTNNPTFTIIPQPFPIGQPPLSSTSGSVLAGGKIVRLLPYGAQINALVTEGKARILSEPSLVVLDGNDGSILVGGEIPIPFSSGGLANTISVIYKTYGIKLDVSPVIVAEDKIQLTVTPEVSEIDRATAVILNGFTIPGLTVRRATTTLQMTDGQTLMIGGLYSNTDNKSVERIPLLSQIPIIGEFFKSTTNSKVERELVILLEPEIVTDESTGVKPPTPGSLENMDIQKPYVPRHEFEQDFPEIENFGKNDKEKPSVPVKLP